MMLSAVIQRTGEKWPSFTHSDLLHHNQCIVLVFLVLFYQIDFLSLDLLTQTDKQLEKFNKKFKGLQMFKASSCKSKNSSRKKSS